MDERELTKLLTRQAARYRTTLTDLEMDVYLDDLGMLSEATVVQAFERYAQSGKPHFPTVPEILKAVRELMPKPLGSTSDEAGALLKRKLGTFAAETRPDVGLTDRERELVRDLGQTVPRLAMLPLADLDKWLTWTYRPAWERRQGGQDADTLLGVGNRPMLVGGSER